jgi:hypothetical protein
VTTGNHDDDDEDDDCIAYEELRPLSFLRSDPFPGLNLSVDGSPVAIVDTSNFGEETDKINLSAALVVSTILWNWHPNALRAFLDSEKYSAIVDSYPPSEKRITHMVTRHERAILVGYYNKDIEWGHQASYGILGDGHWNPLLGSSDGLGGNERPDFVNKMGRMWAMDMMYRRRWQPKRIVHLNWLWEAVKWILLHYIDEFVEDCVKSMLDR